MHTFALPTLFLLQALETSLWNKVAGRSIETHDCSVRMLVLLKIQRLRECKTGFLQAD